MPHLPEIPVFDSVLGLLSALLLLAAVVYLARARSNATSGLTRLRGEARAQDDGGELFAETVPDLTVHRLSFVASMFLHVLLVALLPVAELLDPGPLLFDMDHYDVVILEYQMPERPFALPSDLARADRPEPEPEAPEAQSDEALGLPEVQNEETQRAEGPMEGPVVAIVSDSERPNPRPLIDFASELDVGPEGLGQLPTVPAWSLEKQQAAILALVQFDVEEPGPPESAPGEAMALADLGLTEAPELARDPALPAPPGIFSPAGEAWNLVDGSGGAPAPEFGAGFFGQGPGGGGDIVSALAMHLALGQGAGQAFGERGLLALGGSGENTPFRMGAADGPAGGGWGRGKLTPVPRKFHGIILVSNSLSTLPEAVGVLTGNPVYTVYVDVPDAPRKWILQFCVPQSKGGVEFAGEIVRVLGRKSVDPPYAHRREPLELEFIPTLERLARLPQRVVAYATVDQEGNLHNVRMISGADPKTDSQILASLRSWEFTPAFRDGEPVEVEALFGIPLY